MKTITKEQKLQLVGLKALAEYHNGILMDIGKSVENILNVEEGNSYTLDFVYSEVGLNWLLKGLEVKVK